MKIENIDINKIKPYENNPRINKKAIEKVAESIKHFGFKQPIVVNKDFIIIVGHTRFEAAKKLNFKEVPVLIANDLSYEKAKAYRLADNKTNEFADWDIEKLNIELKELNELDIEFEMSNFGFEDIEIEQKEEEFDIEESLNNTKKSIVKRGDVWKLGNHILKCGDSINSNDLNDLIGKNNIDMVFTDPPYDMTMGGKGCFAEVTKNIKKRIDNIINFDVKKLSFLPNIKTGTFYICTSKNGIKDYLNIFDEYNFNILVWCKTNPTPFTAGTFLPDIEYILYFSNKNRIWNNSLKPTDI